MITNCLVCDAPLRPTRKELYCSAEHKFKHSLRLLEAAATPHYGINPVEIEQESDAVKGSNEERQPLRRQRQRSLFRSVPGRWSCRLQSARPVRLAEAWSGCGVHA